MKNETELARAAPPIRNQLLFSRSRVPSNRIAAYHAQVTKWSQENTYEYTNLVRITSDTASNTKGTQSWRREPRAPK